MTKEVWREGRKIDKFNAADSKKMKEGFRVAESWEKWVVQEEEKVSGTGERNEVGLAGEA